MAIDCGTGKYYDSGCLDCLPLCLNCSDSSSCDICKGTLNDVMSRSLPICDCPQGYYDLF